MFEETQHRYKFDGRLRAKLCRTAVNVPVLAAEAAATAAATAVDGVASSGDGPAAAASARAHSMIGAVRA